jgi:hypothetical protein
MRLLLIAIALFPTSPVQAQIICIEPMVPFCVDADFTYGDEVALPRCRQDLEKFTTKTEEYIRCLSDKFDELTKQATELQRRFDCKESGQSDCP